MSRPSLTAVPAARSSLPILKIRRRLFLGLLIGAASIGLFAGLAWLLAPSELTVDERPRDEEAIALATSVAMDFVSGKNTTVPVAEDVDGRFAKHGAAVAKAKVRFAGSRQMRLGDTTPLTVEQVTFFVTGPEPEDEEKSVPTYDVTVTMGLAPDGWVLAAAPTIEPATLSGGVEVPDYKGLFTNGGDSSSLNDLEHATAIKSQVEKWAQVYTSEGRDSEGLFAITGTNNSSHSYDGLGGWDVENVQITSWLTGENSSENAEEFGQSWVVVRVSLVLNPPASKGATVSAEYDLLLQPEKNPAAPPVTAWGPAGTGPTVLLTNYVNNTAVAPPEQE